MKGIHIRTTVLRSLFKTLFATIIFAVLSSSQVYAESTVTQPTRLDIYGVEEGDIISGELKFYFIGSRMTTETWTLTSSSVKISGSEPIFTYTPPAKMNENFVLSVTSTDAFGNKSLKEINFTINQAAPIIKEALYSKSTKTEHRISYSVTPSNAQSWITLKKEGKMVDSKDYINNGLLTLRENGAFEVVIHAALNGIHAQKTLKLSVDNVPPTISALNLENGAVYASPQTLYFETTGNSYGILYTDNNLGGANIGTGISAKGDYVLTIRSYDGLGNSIRKTIAFKVNPDMKPVPYKALDVLKLVSLDSSEIPKLDALTGKYYLASKVNDLLPSFVINASSYKVTNQFIPITGLYAFDAKITLQKGMTVSLPYDESLTMDEKRLSVYWLDLVNKKWVKEQAIQNIDKNTLTFFTPEDGYFIIGESN